MDEYLQNSFACKLLAIRRSSFYALSILRSQKGPFKEPQDVWIGFQEPEVGVVISPNAVNIAFIKVDSMSKSFVACCAQVWRNRQSRFCEREYLQSSFECITLAIRRISFLHPFDFEDPEEGFQEPQEVWVGFQELEEVGVVVSPIAVNSVLIKVDSKSKSFVACCARVWRSRRSSFCEQEYLQSSFE